MVGKMNPEAKLIPEGRVNCPSNEACGGRYMPLRKLLKPLANVTPDGSIPEVCQLAPLNEALGRKVVPEGRFPARASGIGQLKLIPEKLAKLLL